jgi:hypothetical protein
MDRQEVRDHAQEIAVREAGQIARWQQVQAFADALIPAARRYIEQSLPVPRSSYQNAADRSDNYSTVAHMLLRTIAAIRFCVTDVDNVTRDQISKVVTGLDFYILPSPKEQPETTETGEQVKKTAVAESSTLAENSASAKFLYEL